MPARLVLGFVLAGTKVTAMVIASLVALLAVMSPAPTPTPSDSVCKAWAERWDQASERPAHFAGCMKTTEGPVFEALQKAERTRQVAADVKKWKPENVRLTRNPQATAGCKFVGDVEASPLYDVSKELHSVEMALKLEAAKLRGNLVLQTVGDDFSVLIKGEAYRCKQPKP